MIIEEKKLIEAYKWASKKMEDNPPNGIWGHWQHFVSGLNCYLEDEDYKFLEEWYDKQNKKENK